MNKSISIIAINATLKLRSIVIFTSVFFSACNDEPMQVKPKEDHSNAVVVGVKLLANVTGRLNDTGITQCSNFFDDSEKYMEGHYHSSNENCKNIKDGIAGDVIPKGQDGHSGRDITENNMNDGHAGFSFTKIDHSGKSLAHSAVKWSCVKDNVTGLIWEVKKSDGLHNKDDRYNWYSTDNMTNGGNIGDAAHDDDICVGYDKNNHVYCNTQAFVTRVNAKGYCGANDWRLPSRQELSMIINRGSDTRLVIDKHFFPNTTSDYYWTSSSVADGTHFAWVINFNDGSTSMKIKHGDVPVRLVRGGE